MWRKLKRLRIVQVAHGVVALPADARAREMLEWIAAEAVDREYDDLIASRQARPRGGEAAQRWTVARLRRELRRIETRDFVVSAAANSLGAPSTPSRHAPG